ncbi:sensor histidine kinase [Paenibacillus tuaregi]|uniref:sensor histidine kinase n=1 Tax=Paenibacillus tuaregi TaxID=1816681 RepID=UPI0008392FA6|nr:sensor histidine kinase [Paenibacillus tuaregi]
MTLGGYLKDKIILILLNGIGVLLLSLYLLAVRNNRTTVLLIAITWSLVYLIWATVDYWRRKLYFGKIDALMKELDQPYLVHECIENSWRLEDQLYREILRKSNKAVVERIYQLEHEQKEYREFIEGWIHEVKLPITQIRLACHNQEHNYSRRIERYLTELDNDVEQALFYARSDEVYKDYIIKETKLQEVVSNVLKKNKYLMIQNQMSVEVECKDTTVFSDSKWLEFILGQILLNAMKYKREGGGVISICSITMNSGIKLTVRDDGIGIPEGEKNRIFDKGFTGSNGRSRGKSTGIGLYLCRKLCLKLGLQISAQSRLGEFTEITLLFPKHSFLSKLKDG